MEKISILMAVYNPNLKYFVEQIASLNNQDYPNLELLIIDDCSSAESKEKVSELLKTHVKDISYTFISNQTNKGSNKTFEELTKLATGDYLAYCDQDDIWEKEKLSILLAKLKAEDAVIAYSDLSIIDDDGNKVSDSFKDVSKRLEHKYGSALFEFFLRSNSITGCTMLIKSEIAKQALPFPSSEIYVHDHWLALYGSYVGSIAYVNRPLVRYRIHSNNQIGAKVLVGISDKNDYLNKRIIMEENKVNFVKSRFPIENQAAIKRYETFINTRKQYFESSGISTLVGLIKYIKRDPVLIGFEILLGMSRGSVMKKLLNVAKK